MAVIYNPQMPTGRALHLRGRALLQTPALNKGTAFTLLERQSLGLEGLLPPAVETIEEQSSRAYKAYLRKADDLEPQSPRFPMQHRVHLPRDGAGGVCDRGAARDRRHVPGRGARSRGPGGAFVAGTNRASPCRGRNRVCRGLQAQREGLCVASSPESLRNAIISSQWGPAYASHL